MTKLMTTDEVAELLRLPVQTLYQWRTRRVGPPAMRIGRHLRYDEAEVLAWLRVQQDESRLSA